MHLYHNQVLKHAHCSIQFICFADHYMHILAPEAVTNLDYEQSYDNESLVKITVKCMDGEFAVKELELVMPALLLTFNCFSLPSINTASYNWIVPIPYV